MGRRIAKSKKHKKIKAIDPFYKGERKRLLDKDADRKNNKPSNPDNQEIPRKLKEIVESVKLLKEGKLKRQCKKSKNHDGVVYNEGDDYGPAVKGCERPAQILPKFKRATGESDRHFVRRIHVASMAAIAQSKLEKKFDITFVEDRQGNPSIGKEMVDLASDGKIVVGIKKLPSEAKKLKRKRLEEKRKAKKQVRLEERTDDFEHLKDEIKFGEVATQPPSIPFVPRKAADVTAIRKPGTKQLLLKEMLRTKEMNDIRRESQLSCKSVSDIDLTVKRKHLSVADRRKLDTEREKAIQAYRILKKKQQMQRIACPKKGTKKSKIP